MFAMSYLNDEQIGKLAHAMVRLLHLFVPSGISIFIFVLIEKIWSMAKIRKLTDTPSLTSKSKCSIVANAHAETGGLTRKAV